VQNIGLLIADEVQLVGGEVGPTYEVVISRTRYVSEQTENKTRIVACGVSLANARDLGEWMGAPSHAIFNFSPRYPHISSLNSLITDSFFQAHVRWTWTSISSLSRSPTFHHS
jgi:replicative superfamily II helicase